MTLSQRESSALSPREVRALNRANRLDRNTSGLCSEFVQANLVVLPLADAFDFLRFCQYNPRACPVIDVTEPGDFEPKIAAPGADLRTDIARYQLYRDGELVAEQRDILDIFNGDMVSFLIGCSYSFEHRLAKAGVPLRHHEQRIDGAPMYITNRKCVPAGRFSGRLVVTMRPVPSSLVSEAVSVTARHPESHGAPVSVGNPQSLGITDLRKPDWGEPVQLHAGDVPVFWACGVTSQQIALESKVDFMITHSSGYMFVTDISI
ncbi:putative hydro-lyase [Nocardia camponoti]|uniref:DUF1445 domain-containing protein n=1 Tax=Nocardia camponoti TaxID=1616106 RepID=A0A917V425_9NOCA|nr:putative hydro-lyase [Nocardia camponoti]GGK34318.1 DUF1445 domain-containing protein [Nocardia camponoti]